MTQDVDAPHVRLHQPKRQLQNGGFSRSSHSKQNFRLTPLEDKRDAIQHKVSLEGNADVLKGDRDVASQVTRGRLWRCQQRVQRPSPISKRVIKKSTTRMST